ncbi:MAG: DUF72 domain-containing protein [Candidatus Anstonellales archaeon]
MKVFVGTSGWAYGWNKGGNFQWYVENSKLNAVEINASFYRFPFPSQVKGWAKRTKKIRWAVKVNRLITHVFKFEKMAKHTWKRFEEIFSPLQENIDFYLFQLPPNSTPKMAKKIERFAKFTRLKEKFALEVRNEKWFSPENLEWAKRNRITWVSVDAPEFPREIFKTTDFVYLRMHGRESWYSYNYSREELKEIAKRIKKAKPKSAHIFFNNNHDMLNNAREMKRIFFSCIFKFNSF